MMRASIICALVLAPLAARAQLSADRPSATLTAAYALGAGSTLGALRPVQPGADGLLPLALEVGATTTLPVTHGLRVMVKAALVRDVSGGMGGFVQATGSYDLGRLRLSATVHAEKIFAPGRDPVDVVAVVGASVRVLAPLRIGVEWIGQDLEELANDDGAEGGMRSYFGPNLSLSFYGDRLRVSAGAAVETVSVPTVLSRASIAFVY